MAQTAVPLVLADKDRAELAHWSQEGSAWLAERARMVLACGEPGSGVARVAAELGSTRMTVRKWRRRFAEEGLAGLADEPRPQVRHQAAFNRPVQAVHRPVRGEGGRRGGAVPP